MRPANGPKLPRQRPLPAVSWKICFRGLYLSIQIWIPIRIQLGVCQRAIRVVPCQICRVCLFDRPHKTMASPQVNNMHLLEFPTGHQIHRVQPHSFCLDQVTIPVPRPLSSTALKMERTLRKTLTFQHLLGQDCRVLLPRDICLECRPMVKPSNHHNSSNL